MFRLFRPFCVGAAVFGFAAVASAQSTALLPDTTQVTTLTANVSEQARLTVPSSVTFNVTDTSVSTVAANTSLSVSNIVLATATKQLRIAVQADAATFTPPVTGATSWSASDVSWTAGTWTSATGVVGTLSSSSYNTVATCAADAGSCNTTALAFTLAAKPEVKRAGNHTLVIRWRFDATGS